MKHTNVLVTGSAGFIGSDLVKKLKARGHTVTGVDNMLMGSDSTTTDIIADAADLSAMKSIVVKAKPDVAYLLAAVPCEGFSLFAPGLINYNTYGTTVATLTSVLDTGIKRVVLISSMAVYGHGKAPFTETDICEPADPYGIAKFASEMLVRVMCEAYGVDWVILRPHNVYGPGQRLDDALRNVIGIFINRALRNLPMIVYGDGTQKRAFSYIDDVTNCIIEAGSRSEAVGQVINIGSPIEYSVNDLAKVIGKIIGFSEVQHEEARVEVKDAFTTSEKAQQLLGYTQDSVDLEEGIRRMYNWAKLQGPQTPVYLQPELTPDWMPATWIKKTM